MRSRHRETQRGLGLGVEQGSTDTANSRTDSRELQGMATKRHADQRAPRWDDPPESDAVRLLDRLWGQR
jgi:hypothetical protein